MELNVNQSCLVKNTKQELACVDGILSFLINGAESKEPSLAVATILSNIEDACSTAPIERKTAESDKLLAFKQYVHSIYNMYITGNSIPIKINQNTWDDYKSVLSRITDVVVPEKEEEYITQRLNMFVKKIQEVVDQYLLKQQIAEEEYKKGRMKYGIIGAVALLLIWLPASGIFSYGMDYISAGGYIILLSLLIGGYAAGVKVYDYRNNN